MVKTSAGLLMYRFNNGKLEVLLAHPGGPLHARRDVGAWSIPKGEIDLREQPLAAARREFEEETGHRPDGPYLELGQVQQKGGKIVHAWAFAGNLDPAQARSNTFKMEWPPRSGQIAEFPEIDRVDFFTLEIAREKINPAQVPLLEELARRVGVG